MFDKTINEYESKVVAVTKEIEKTISPDKVTEMYDAVKEQVEKDFICSYTIESNSMNAVVVVLAEEFNTNTKRYIARYTLNEKEIVIKGILPEDYKGKQTSYLANEIRNHYAHEISMILLRETAPIIHPLT